MKNLVKISAIVIVAIFLAATSWAQGQSQMGGQGTQQQMQMKQQPMAGQAGQMDRQQVSGKVLKEKEVGMKGTDIKHKVVLLENAQGKRVAVDLGPAQALKDLNIKTGKNISATGKIGRVNDRPVLFAQQVNVEGKMAQISRKQFRHAKKQPMDGAYSKSQAKGKIAQEKDVSIKGTNEKNKVVLLMTEPNRYLVIDLGPTQKLGELDLKKGKDITVYGTPVRVGQKLVFMGTQVAANGKSMQIQRPGFQQQLNGAGGQQMKQQPQMQQNQMDQQRQMQQQQMDQQQRRTY